MQAEIAPPHPGPEIPSPRGGVAVSVRDVGKRFGSARVLEGVSLDIREGEFFSLLGPSGCGKTTLLRILAGFEEPDRGSVRIGDTDVLGVPPNRRHVNTVFQNYALFPHLTVFENVAFPLRLKKLPRGRIEEEVMEHLRLVQLEAHRDKRPEALSGGMKQRVAIARALINRPGALLLDEPLSALDAKLRQQLLVELEKLHDRIGITFILVTHDQQEALSISDRVAVMDRGRVLQVGNPAEIYEHPNDLFTAEFIGETNLIIGKVRALEGPIAVIDTPQGLWRVRADAPPAPGTSLTLALRPERIRLSRGDPTAFLQARVEDLIYTGSQTRVFLRTEGGLLQATALEAHGRQYRKGMTLGLSWNDNDPWIIPGP
ncbi:MAG: ABC transporter ATP-binding protein [Spirochaetes bacterium]|nr:ABC transporter ATP-binding protein [Spirochaetota bacterium]